MLDPRRLRLLVALDSLGTVRAVAQQESMSPSAVSQALATLETESGVALLSRHGRSVRLTPAGRALVARSVDILDRIELAEDELRDWRDGATGVVRVGAPASALGAFVIDAARDVARQHPGLRVQLSELYPESGLPLLERGAVDIAVVADLGNGAIPQSDAFDRTSLPSDELVAVLPTGHHHRRASVALGELRDERWIVDGSDLERHVVAECRRAGFEPRIEGRLSSHGTLLHAVSAGLGVTVLPTSAIEPGYEVQTRRLRPAAPRRLAVLTRAGAAARRHSVVVARDAIVAAARRRP